MAARFNPNRTKQQQVVRQSEQSELATLTEAAEFLRVCERTMARRLKARKVAGQKLDGAWRIPWKSLREYAGVAG